MACKICGKPSGYYPLCPEHFKQKEQGKIVKCDECGEWHYVDQPCSCRKQSQKSKPQKESIIEDNIEEPAAVVVNQSNKYRCLVCGAESNGMLFCSECYGKYHKKKLLFSIQNCSIVTLLDESYEGIHRCADGHIVKSKSEAMIDDYLFRHHIAHAYERVVPIDNNPEHNLHPDFYLTEQDIYIEHWGFDETNAKYTQAKQYKIQKYKELGLTVICTTEKDTSNLEANLDRKIKFCERGKVNEE